LLAAVRQNRHNCRFEDLERLLLALGFTVRRTSASHVIFKRGATKISIPQRKPVKEVYVDLVLDLIAPVIAAAEHHIRASDGRNGTNL
jgi:predicted RNA binding protein YcfA (HicA-like mRNA interferase family)